MHRPSLLGHWLRRTREVGVRGIARRIAAPLRDAAQGRAKRLWHKEFGQVLSDANLLRYLDTSALERLARHPIKDLSIALEVVRQHSGRGRFFIDPGEPGLSDRFTIRHATAAAALVEQAKAALAGDLSWVVPGAHMDWHAALPRGERWSLASSEAIDLSGSRGDVRLTWEVGRCTHFVRLAQAWWLTRDPVFANAVVEGMGSFVAENPPGFGIAWAHAQEVGLRAIAWLWAFHFIRDSEAFGMNALRCWIEAIIIHGEFVASHLSDHVITHNHLVSEAGALMVLGLALPELRPAARWAALGSRILFREIRKQVDEEGVQGELSTHYHAFVMDSYIAALILRDRLRLPTPHDLRTRLEGMAQFVSLLLGSDGSLPAIGDSDAGRAWRLGVEPLDRRDALAAAAVAFNRPNWGAIAGDAPGAFFLTGGREVPGSGQLTPEGVAHRFMASGIGVARTGFDAEAEMVVFRAGPTRFRRDVSVSHGHADALSVLWRIGRHDVLLDPGVFLYSETQGWRKWLRRTPAHSTPVVDGADQADVTSLRFGVLGLRASRWCSFEGDCDRMAAEAEHPAQGAPRVRRRVAWLRGGTLALCDEVFGNGLHEGDIWFQLPRAEGSIEGPSVRLLLEGRLALLLQCFGEIDHIELFRPRQDEGPGPGWNCPRYGIRQPGTALRVALGKRTLPFQLVSLLQVAGDPSALQGGTFKLLQNGEVLVHVGRGTIGFPRSAGVRLGEQR